MHIISCNILASKQTYHLVAWTVVARMRHPNQLHLVGTVMGIVMLRLYESSHRHVCECMWMCGIVL